VFNILSVYIKIESDNPTKFESLAHKRNIQLCLFYSLTTYLVSVFVFSILICINHN